jgi:hypothetical protein
LTRAISSDILPELVIAPNFTLLSGFREPGLADVTMCKRVSSLFVFAVFAALAAAGCGSSPAAPTVGMPTPISPASSISIKNSDQPVTLTVQNATSSQSGVIYTFEVAGDSAFSVRIQTKDGIAQGAGGQTSATLDPLPAGSTYYWHVRASVGGTVGSFGPASTFSIGPGITVSAPSPLAPLTGAQTGVRPTLRSANATHTGPVSGVVYKFEISTNSNFSSIAASGTVPEGPGETDFTPSANLGSGTFYWRVTATDSGSGISSTPSTVQSFTVLSSAAAQLAAQLGFVLWPGNVPPGTPGQAVMGDNCEGSLNWAPATCYSPPNGYFQSPQIEALRYFDLFDRGMDPPTAIAWMNANGYTTIAQWYPPPDKAVLGIGPYYLAARNKFIGVGAIWDIVSSLG